MFVYRFRNEKNTCDVSTLIDYFCLEDGGYNEKLVRLVVGAMTSECGQSLITYKAKSPTDGNTPVDLLSLELTDRGRALVEMLPIKATKNPKKNVKPSRRMYEFFYIQLVVDDYLLPIPKKLRGDFAYQGDYSHRFTYHKYDNKMHRLLKKKLNLCGFFYVFLKCALEEEFEVYKPVMEKLKRIEVIKGNGDCLNFAIEKANKEFEVKLPSKKDQQRIREAVKEVYGMKSFMILPKAPTR